MKLHTILTVIDSCIGRNKQMERFLMQDLADCDWITRDRLTLLRQQCLNYGMNSDMYNLVAATEDTMTLTLFSQTCRLLKILLDEILKYNELLISHVDHCGIMLTYRRMNGQSIPAFEAAKVYRDIPHLCPTDSPSYLPGTTLCEVLLQHYELRKDKTVMDVGYFLGDKRAIRDSYNLQTRHPELMPHAGATHDSLPHDSRYGQQLQVTYNIQQSKSASRQAVYGDTNHHLYIADAHVSSKGYQAQVSGQSFIDHQAPIQRHPIPWDGRTYRPATALSNSNIPDDKSHWVDRQRQSGSGDSLVCTKAVGAHTTHTTGYNGIQIQESLSDHRPTLKTSQGYKQMEISKQLMSEPSSQIVSMKKPEPTDIVEKAVTYTDGQLLKAPKKSAPVVHPSTTGSSNLKRKHDQALIDSVEKWRAKRLKMREEFVLKTQRENEAFSKNPQKEANVKPVAVAKITSVLDQLTPKLKRKADDATKLELPPKKQKLVLKINKAVDGSWRATD